METKTQFSVFLVNRPRVLSNVCRKLAEEKINIIALTLTDGQEHGVLRLVAASAARARAALKKMNAAFTETKVFAVEMPNSPGAAADVCEKLAAAKVAINYMYCSTAGAGRAVGIFRLGDIEKAKRTLAAKPKTKRDKRVRKRQPAMRR